MRRTLIITLMVLLGASTLLPAGTATADHFPHTKCDPSGDSCVSVKKINGVRRLRIALLFRYIPRHQLCVKKLPDGRKTCHTYRVRRIPGFPWGSSINWRKNFPFRGRGIYRVTWLDERGNLYGALKFHTR